MTLLQLNGTSKYFGKGKTWPQKARLFAGFQKAVLSNKLGALQSLAPNLRYF
jgi:hypothetical protein